MNVSKQQPISQPSPHGRVTFLEGRGDLPMVEITTPWSTAEVYLHGAHITHFQKQGEPPLLFLSQCSRFDAEHPIRGGIPIIFPWLGKPAGKTGQHGFARVKDWELCEVTSPADGSVTLRLRLPECGASADCAACDVEYVVTISDTLSAELRVSNKSGREFEFENCLHTYFAVGNIQAVKVTGLKGVEYLNQPTGFSRHTETMDAIQFGEEVDRIYLATGHPVEICDARLKRIIRVEKEGSNSTVVWNPWIAKAKAMPDYGDDEFREMVCVESGNVATDRVVLRPGQTSRLQIRLSSRSLV